MMLIVVTMIMMMVIIILGLVVLGMLVSRIESNANIKPSIKYIDTSNSAKCS